MKSVRKECFTLSLVGLFAFGLILITASCSFKQQNISTSPKVALEKDTLELVNHSGIEFEVELAQITLTGTEVHCSVYNKSKKAVHYITETCYSLQPFLRFDSENMKSVTKWDCFSNNVAIKTLNPGDTIRFEAVIFDLEHKSSPKRIGLDFRTVNKAITENELEENRSAMDRLDNAPTREQDVIWVNFSNK